MMKPLKFAIVAERYQRGTLNILVRYLHQEIAKNLLVKIYSWF